MIGISRIVLLSVCASMAASLFVHSLGFAAHLFYQHWHWAGLLAIPAAFLIYRWQHLVENLPPETPVHNLWRIPMTYVSSCLSHLSGMSVGREGAAIEIGKRIGLLFKTLPECGGLGICAAFSALFLHPSVGLIFVLEYHYHYKIPAGFSRLKFLATLTMASLIGYGMGTELQTPHWHPGSGNSATPLDLVSFLTSPMNLLAATALIAIGMALILIELFIAKRRAHSKLLWLLLLSGALSTILTFFLGTSQYNSLSTDLLQTSLWQQNGWLAFFGKTLFSFIALIGAWPGGFFVPLMTMGATCASALATNLQLSGADSYALVAVGVFLFVTPRFKSPLTCSLLTWQLFGDKIGALSLGANLLIYFAQRLLQKVPRMTFADFHNVFRRS